MVLGDGIAVVGQDWADRLCMLEDALEARVRDGETGLVLIAELEGLGGTEQLHCYDLGYVV